MHTRTHIDTHIEVASTNGCLCSVSGRNDQGCTLSAKGDKQQRAVETKQQRPWSKESKKSRLEEWEADTQEHAFTVALLSQWFCSPTTLIIFTHFFLLQLSLNVIWSTVEANSVLSILMLTEMWFNRSEMKQHALATWIPLTNTL